jgi:PBP1b-binding outer membrane lipoprotein LpoB
MVRIIILAMLLSSCSQFEQKMQDAQQLKCTPPNAVGCTGFITEKQ